MSLSDDLSAYRHAAPKTDGPRVFVVMGATGEYSDHRQWAVMAYLEESPATYHADEAKKRAHEIEKARENDCMPYDAEKDPNKYDPAMTMDYTGTDYYVLEVPLATKEPSP